jgi:hypothetical protein
MPGGLSILQALNGLDFEIRRRKTLGPIGEAGPGKTAIGRILWGTDPVNHRHRDPVRPRHSQHYGPGRPGCPARPAAICVSGPYAALQSTCVDRLGLLSRSISPVPIRRKTATTRSPIARAGGIAERQQGALSAILRRPTAALRMPAVIGPRCPAQKNL